MNAAMKRALASTAVMASTIAIAVSLGWNAPSVYHTWKNQRSGDFSSHVSNQPQSFTLYGTSTCPACMRARKFLTQAGIPFNDQRLETSPEAMAKYDKLGQNSVPIFVSAKKIIIGFNPKEYEILAREPRS